MRRLQRALLIPLLVAQVAVAEDQIFNDDFEQGMQWSRMKPLPIYVDHRKTQYFEEWTIIDEEQHVALEMKKRKLARSIFFSSEDVNFIYSEHYSGNTYKGYTILMELVNHLDLKITMHGTESERIGDVCAHKRFDFEDRCKDYEALDKKVQQAISDGIQQFYQESRRLMHIGEAPSGNF